MTTCEPDASRPPTTRSAATSWRRSCAAAASASRPSRSACLAPGAGARRACGARRSPSSPASASPGTRGSSRAATSTPRPQVLDAIARTLRFDPHERAHLFTLAGDGRHRRRQTRCARLSPAVELVLDQLEPYPALAVQRPLRHPRLQPRLGDASVPRPRRRCRSRTATACGCSSPTRTWRRTVLDWDAGRRAHGGAVPGGDGRARGRAGLEGPDRAAAASLAGVRRDVGAARRPRRPRTRSSASSTRWSGCCGSTYTYLWLDPGLGTRIVTYTPADNRTAGRLEALQRTLDADGAVA